MRQIEIYSVVKLISESTGLNFNSACAIKTRKIREWMFVSRHYDKLSGDYFFVIEDALHQDSFHLYENSPRMGKKISRNLVKTTWVGLNSIPNQSNKLRNIKQQGQMLISFININRL